jgi:aspartate aminotransferase-like enzyme
MKGKVFRIGSMGEVNAYHVLRTLSSIASAMTIMGLKTNSESIAVASENLKSLN